MKGSDPPRGHVPVFFRPGGLGVAGETVNTQRSTPTASAQSVLIAPTTVGLGRDRGSRDDMASTPQPHQRKDHPEEE